MTNAGKVRERVIGEVVQGLDSHPSKKGHPAVKLFAQVVADRLEQFASIQDALKETTDKHFPKGSAQRYRAATLATIKLAHTLQQMTPDELDHFVPPAITMAEMAGLDVSRVITEGLAEWLDAVPRWASMTIAAAKVIELRQALPPVRKRDLGSKSEQIAMDISWLAKAWLEHFHEFPSAAGESPFTTVSQIYFQFRGKHKRVPSHPVIRDALTQFRAKLGE